MINRIKSFQWKSIVIGIVLLFVSQFAVSFIPVQLPNKKMLVLAIFSVFLYFLLTKLRDERSLMRNALVTILIFGVSVSITKPVQFGLDEEAHLRTTIRIADSGIFSRENEELNDYSTILSHDSLRNPNAYKGTESWLNVEHKESRFSGKIIRINNLSLVPAAIGWNVGKIISNKVFVSYYLGRIFNVLAYLFLVWMAFRISKKYKEMIYLLSTFPAFIFICAGYHYDYLYFGLSLVLVAIFTNICIGNEKISKKRILQFQLTSLLFAFPKFPFILLGSLIAVLPKKFYVDIKDRIFALISFVVMVGIAGIYYLNGTIFKHLFGVVSNSASSTGSGSSISFFLKHPLPIFRTLLDSVYVVIDTISSPISYVTTGSRFLQAMSTILFILLFIMITSRLDIKISTITKRIILLLFTVISLLTIYAISGDARVYTLGNLNVGGVQGRYYYAALLFLPVIVSEPLNKLLNLADKESTEYPCAFMQYSIAFLNVLTLGIALYTQITKV